MIREMRIRNYSPRTIKTYVSLLSQLSRYYNSSPDQLTVDQIKDYLQHKVLDDSCSISLINQTIGALKILYQDVLGISWENLNIKNPDIETPIATAASSNLILYKISNTFSLHNSIILSLLPLFI